MIASFIIIFREVLEISIILSIIMAATRGVARRGHYVLLGIGGGLAGSAVVAAFAGSISSALEGVGQEVFNGTILLLAAFMIAWTTIWMQRHGRAISQKMKQVGNSVSSGDMPLYALSIVVAVSMWREGAEIVLFMTGILGTSEDSILAIAGGVIAGGTLAALIGLFIYLGIITIPSKYIFAVTSWMLILLASGMSAAAAGYLVAADILPAIIEQMWNSSWLISEDSLLGKILHAMIGYSEQPSAIQLIFYFATLAGILLAQNISNILARQSLKTVKI